jgi:hypothetical protein
MLISSPVGLQAQVGDNMLLIQVHCIGLNFADIFAYGRLDQPSLPKFFASLCCKQARGIPA